MESFQMDAMKLTLFEMIERLEILARPVVNDRRQDKYCEYISLFLSYFGNEWCMVTGSTKEKTRLRLRQNESDYDYLVISEICIPSECLEYKDGLPCFVQINGMPLQDKFPKVEFIQGKFLPSNILRDIRPEVFKHIGDIYHIVSKLGSTRGRHTLKVSLDHQIKPGISLVTYTDPKCSDLGLKDEIPQRDHKSIIRNVNKSLQNESADVKRMTLSAIRSVKGIIDAYEQNDPMEHDSESEFKQTCGKLMDAVVESEEAKEEFISEQNVPSTSKKPRFETQIDSYAPVDMDKSHPNESTQYQIMGPDSRGGSGNNLKQETSSDEEKILIEYTCKSSKDFIPVFPIIGKPKYLDEWKVRYRRSNWPPTDVINDIYDGKFFLVAKPAIESPNEEQDFCLGFNMGEMKLAHAMTSVQRSVMLIIKVFQRGVLFEYSDELTTFHWKTAIYRVSEEADQSMIENKTNENILNFLDNVLVYMTNCLCQNQLEHYFVPSNLFAGKDENTMFEIASRIADLQISPLDDLRHFFIEQTKDNIKYDMVLKSKLKEFQENYNDPGEDSLVSSVISLLKGFVKEDREIVREAFKGVITEALDFFIEEEARGRSLVEIDVNSPALQSIIQSEFVRETLINSCVSLLLDQMDSEEVVDLSEISRNFLSAVIQRVVVGNM